MQIHPDTIRTFFPELADSVIQKLITFCELVIEKNTQINLISRKDIEHIVEAHLLPSLAIYKLFPFKNNCRVLDIGTGGGFPGIPLAITNPGAKFTLIDSIRKKIYAVQEFAKNLQLNNVRCVWDRVENLQEKYDIATGRAVKNIPEFCKLAAPKLKNNGSILYLTGGDIEPVSNSQVFDLFSLYQQRFCETKKLLYITPFLKN